ncbi:MULTISPECIES: DUF2586 family protein [unclassified Borrelia]|uniref:DUF2586 family protein n=1 Tax=unclassified Borrelia TaxID=2649934 RepID=UPI001E480B7D|nr:MULTISPECIES: DUF2586 family protein [unclassified Borrelia]UGQ16683.1 DUF2586 family protein [Borrelia sp. RT5S]UGQ17841.1 DUF2586 family protein [Borrelia sp. RT1S]
MGTGYKLPDLETQFKDFSLRKEKELKSGVFAILGYAPKLKTAAYAKLTSLEDCSVLGHSMLADTCKDFFTYSVGTIYAIPIGERESSMVTTAGDKSKDASYTLTITGGDDLYKPIDIKATISKGGTKDAAQFFLEYEGIKTKVMQVKEDSEIEIQDLGIKIKFSATSSYSYPEGSYVTYNLAPKLKNTQKGILAALESMLAIEDYIEFLALDINSKASDWQYIVSKLDHISTENKREFFVVMRFRNLAKDETMDTYIEDLRKERKSSFTPSIKLLVLGQPVIYENYLGKATRGIPFGIFLGKLSSTLYYGSLSEVLNNEGRVRGIIGLSSDVTLTHVKQIAQLGYTGFRNVEGFKGVYVTEARLFSPDESDYDCVERTRVMYRAEYILRRELVGNFLNRNLDISAVEGEDSFTVLIKESCKKAIEKHMSGSYSDFTIEVQTQGSLLQEGIIVIKLAIVPLGKIRYMKNEFRFSLPKAS